MQIAVVYAALFVLTLSIWYSARRRFDGKGVWLAWTQHESPWCERDRPLDLAREPANSLSDFAYLLVALFIAACGTYDLIATPSRQPRNAIVARPLISFSYAFINFVHFAGTFWNHSSRTLHGHVLDCTGMYSVVAFLGLYAYWQHAARTQPGGSVSAPGFAAGTVALVAFFYAYEWTFWGDVVRDVTMASIVFSTLWACHRLYALAPADWQAWLMKIAIASLLSAYVLWNLDTHHIVCWPESPFQLHALWHYITAADIALMYMCGRSERYVSVLHTFTTDTIPACN